MSLTRQTRKPRAFRFKTYDLEWTADFKVRLVGVYDGKHIRHFFSVEDFLDAELISRNAGVYYFAHFGGRFDFTFLLPVLHKRGYRVSCQFSGSSVVRAEVTRGGQSWIFCDLQFLFKVPLGMIGKSVGIPKLECAFDAPISELMDYNRVDCIIPYVAIERTQAAIADLGGELKTTIGATALDLFRRSYLRTEVPTSKILNKLLRPHFVAARVEMVRRELRGGGCWDINQSYPHSMQCAPLPGELFSHNRKLDSPLYVAHVRVRVPDMHFPPLPVRMGASIYFPVGVFDGWYTQDDITCLWEAGGTVEHVYEAFHFRPWTDLAEYAEDLHERRLGAGEDEFLRDFYKKLANSIFGKMCEREEKAGILYNPASTQCPHDGAHVIDGISTCMRMIRPGIWAVTGEAEIAHAHLPIPMTICSRSRHRLWQFGVKTEALSYLDTDSIHGLTDWGTTKELGGLKHEYSYDVAYFAAQKLYIARNVRARDGGPILDWKGNTVIDKVVAKGMPRLDREAFDYLASGGVLMVERTRGVRGVARHGSPGSEFAPKSISKRCMQCGAYCSDTCWEHPYAGVEAWPKARPKRRFDNIESSPWTYRELLEPW